MKFDVIVVGTGITGAATAYFLKKRGVANVLPLDREEPAAGGTGKVQRSSASITQTRLRRTSRANPWRSCRRSQRMDSIQVLPAQVIICSYPKPCWRALEQILRC